MKNTGEFILAMSVFAYFMAAIVRIVSHRERFSHKWTNIFLIASAVLITFDMFLLVYCQVKHDFQYAYVYEHTSSDLAPAYLISALWAGQEGSFLLWAVINSWMGFAFCRRLGKHNNQEKLTFAAFSVINMGIMVMTLLSDPFKTMAYTPTEGLGLNLSLQDPWMAVHPPLVFIGYSSMAVLFSLGLYIEPKIKESRNKDMLRKWALWGWLFLSMGIFTGSIWAYRALGWGGYWAWDPIENAALIPWILLTGVSHGEISKSKAGNRVKCMLPFVMAAFGTFLARSGILKDNSAHAYAGSSLSIPLFVFLAILILAILYFGLSKLKRDEAGGQNAGISISLILNVSLYVFAALILFGTIYPLISGNSADMGFFNYSALFFSIVFAILFIAQNYAMFKKNCYRVLFISTVIAAVICLSMKFTSLTWLLILWVFLIPLMLWMVNILRLKPKLHLIRIKNLFSAIAHAGVMLLILGAVTSTVFSEKGTVLITNGQLTSLGYGTCIDGVSLNTDKSTIIHTIGSDIILSLAEEGLSSPAVQAVNYTTRPLIWLFWTGGVLIILGILGALLKRPGDITVSDSGSSASNA